MQENYGSDQVYAFDLLELELDYNMEQILLEGGPGGVVDAVCDAVSGICDAASDFISGVGDILSDPMGVLSDPFGAAADLFDCAVDFVEDVVDEIEEAAEEAWDAVCEFASDVWDTVCDVWDKFGKQIIGIVAVVACSWIPGVNAVVAAAVIGALQAGMESGWDLEAMAVGAVAGAVSQGCGGSMVAKAAVGALKSGYESGWDMEAMAVGAAAGAIAAKGGGSLSSKAAVSALKAGHASDWDVGKMGEAALTSAASGYVKGKVNFGQEGVFGSKALGETTDNVITSTLDSCAANGLNKDAVMAGMAQGLGTSAGEAALGKFGTGNQAANNVIYAVTASATSSAVVAAANGGDVLDAVAKSASQAAVASSLNAMSDAVYSEFSEGEGNEKFMEYCKVATDAAIAGAVSVTRGGEFNETFKAQFSKDLIKQAGKDISTEVAAYQKAKAEEQAAVDMVEPGGHQTIATTQALAADQPFQTQPYADNAGTTQSLDPVLGYDFGTEQNTGLVNYQQTTQAQNLDPMLGYDFSTENSGLMTYGSSVYDDMSGLVEGDLVDPNKPWVSSAGPVTSGNSIEHLTTGKQTFDHIEESIKGAEESVYITAWTLFEPSMMLDRSDPTAVSLGELLQQKGAELSAEGKPGVKILIDENWAVEKINSSEDSKWVEMAAEGEFEGVEVVYAPVSPEANVVEDTIFTNHQKSVIVDSEKAYVLGQNFRDGDWDVAAHPVSHPDRPDTGPRQDVGVAIQGPAVEDVEANFVQRWNAVEGNDNKLTVNEYAGVVDPDGAQIQVLRTQMDGESDIATARLQLIAKAKNYIYIEDQYAREPEIFQAIANRLEENENLKVVLITNPDDSVLSPSAGHTEASLEKLEPYMGGDNPRVSTFQLESSEKREGVLSYFDKVDQENISLHSKVMIVDDEYVLQGSANMNVRSNYYDSELNVLISDKAYAKDLRETLWENHIKDELPIEDVDTSIQLMRNSAQQNAENEANDKMYKGHLNPLDMPDGHTWKNFIPVEIL